MEKKHQARDRFSLGGVWRKVLAFCLGFLLLFLVELALRLLGVGPGRNELLLKSGTPPPGIPLFVKKGKTWQTSSAYLGKVNSLRFQVPKPAGVFRVLTVGDSTVYGFPFGDRLSFSRLLQIMLDSVGSAWRFEVINCGVLGANSRHHRAMIHELFSAEPDVVVLYLGHNEFLEGPPHQRKNWPSFLVRGHYRLLNLKLYRLGFIALSRLKKKEDRGPSYYSRLRREGKRPESERAFWNEADRQEIAREFQENLNEILRVREKAKVPLILCVPASNLFSFAPGGAVHGQYLSPEEKARFDFFLETAMVKLGEKNYSTAEENFQAALALDSSYALLRFFHGVNLFHLGRGEEMQKEFQASRDLDDFPIRAPSDLIALLRANSQKPGVILVDLERAFAQHSAFGVPGEDLFLDNVHPNEVGIQVLAREILVALIVNGLVPAEGDWRGAVERAAAEYVRNLPPSFLADSYLLLVDYAEHQGRLRLAESLIRRAQLLSPSDGRLFGEEYRLRFQTQGKFTWEEQ